LRDAWSTEAESGRSSAGILIYERQSATQPCFNLARNGPYSCTSGAISARGVTEYSFNLRLAGVIERTLFAHGYGNVFRIGWEKKEPFVPYGQSKFAGSQSVSIGSSRFRAATIFPAVEL
jgi:hypothetical protein